MQDHDLDKLLRAASTPKPAKGFEQRVLAKIAPQTSNVVAFPARKSSAPWLIGLPLAASLALGIWLGATNTLPSSTSFLVSQTSEDSAGSGFDDVVALIEENLT